MGNAKPLGSSSARNSSGAGRNPGYPRGELGRQVFVSGGYVGQFKLAVRKPQLDVAMRFDDVLQTDGFFERTWRQLIDDKRHAHYFAAVAALEALAIKICEFAPTLVPGLMQTGAYARAVTIETNPFVPDEYVEEQVAVRLERARILKGTTRPEYWVVFHQNALRIPVGGPAAMAEQLERVAAMMRERTALVSVVPYSAGAHAAMTGDLRLMGFEDAPPIAYTKASFSGTLMDDPAVVARARRSYDLLRGAALSPKASLALLESAAEEHTPCASTT